MGYNGQLSPEAFDVKARALRPFYFIVVVWGERFTDYLVNFCIASLLSPNNIPALRNSGNKFLIAATDEDWARLQPHPLFRLLKQYIEPVFIRIPPCPEGENKYVHMGLGHKLATEMAFRDHAYGAILTADLVFSDGTIAALQRHAVNGVEVVLTAALRFGEEPFCDQLKQRGFRIGAENGPLVLTGRELVAVGIRSFHPETLSFGWESHAIWHFPSAVWWHVPREDGVLVHSLSWAPLLMDYGAIKRHDSSAIDNWTIDGDYVHGNFGLQGKVHVVRDSDEMMLVSFGPMAEGGISNEKSKAQRTLKKGKILFDTYHHPMMDLLKRKAFSVPVYWHSRDINAGWETVRKKAERVVTNTTHPSAIRIWLFRELPQRVLDGRQKCRDFARRIGEVGSRMMGLANYAKSALRYYWGTRHHAWELFRRAMSGDPAARTRIKQSLKVFANHFRKIV